MILKILTNSLKMSNNDIIWKDMPDHPFLEVNNKMELRKKSTGHLYKIQKNNTYINVYHNKVFYCINV